MMLERKSMVLSAFFPESKFDSNELVRAIEIASKNMMQVVEFYFEGEGKYKVKKVLQKNDLGSVYLGAIPTKTNKLHLSSLNEDDRLNAVSEVKKCIDSAIYFDSERILVNGGARPKKKTDSIAAYNMLKKSLLELLDYISTLKSSLILTFEPGDTDVEYFELVGETKLAVKLADEISTHYKNFRLTIDSSHLRQLGENEIDSIKLGYKHCDHIHLANSCLKNTLNPLYGDKHPAFSEENGEYDLESIESLYLIIKQIYKDKDFIIGQEIICRDKDTNMFFDRCRKDTPWFYC